MEQLCERIEQLAEDIMIEERVASAETIERGREVRNEIDAEIIDLTLDTSYRRHVLQFLKEESDKPGKTLCSCADPYCGLKHGEVPPELDTGDSVEDGVSQFLDTHSGDAAVLLEAREEWIQRCAAAEDTLRESLTILRRDEGALDDEDGDGETKAGAEAVA